MDGIPLIDLRARYEAAREDIDAAVRRVLESGCYLLGPEVRAFEKEFAEYCGAKYCAGVGSGADAIYLALAVLGVGKGDEVLVAPNTYVAAVEAVIRTGAKPVFVDLKEGSFHPDPWLIEQAVTGKTTGIVAVHLFGEPAPMDAIRSIARKKGLRLVEDAAQAQGAEIDGRKVGTLGDAACFSFFPENNLGALGDAGAVVTNHIEVKEKVAMLRNHGRQQKYLHELPGVNSRMDEIQAAVLRVGLRRLDEWNDLRRAHAAKYEELLGGREGIITPKAAENVKHVFHQYVVRIGNRDEARYRLNKKGIETGVHYPVALHLQPAFEGLGYGEGAFPECEKVVKEILSLPMYPELTEEQIETVCGELIACVEGE
ncbi:MAG: DegT/DnrJ/EryC1/StrS family aminotransferase [bacterium]